MAAEIDSSGKLVQYIYTKENLINENIDRTLGYTFTMRKSVGYLACVANVMHSPTEAKPRKRKSEENWKEEANVEKQGKWKYFTSLHIYIHLSFPHHQVFLLSRK